MGSRKYRFKYLTKEAPTINYLAPLLFESCMEVDMKLEYEFRLHYLGVYITPSTKELTGDLNLTFLKKEISVVKYIGKRGYLFYKVLDLLANYEMPFEFLIDYDDEDSFILINTIEEFYNYMEDAMGFSKAYFEMVKQPFCEIENSDLYKKLINEKAW